METPGGAAIVMELVDGVVAAAAAARARPRRPEAALVVLKGSLLGLAAAHARGVVHRDYKPENVLVTADGAEQAGRLRHRHADRSTFRHHAGHPAYMAPEQWTGAPASPAADIYAATAIFFECLTGHPPYDGKDLLTLRRQHATAPIPTDPAPTPVHELLRHGMAKQPADRPQPAQVFIELLERVAAAGYGAEWEENGLRELARRAALLAALWPFPDGAGGATSLASTVLGEMFWCPGRRSGRAGGGPPCSPAARWSWRCWSAAAATATPRAVSPPVRPARPARPASTPRAPAPPPHPPGPRSSRRVPTPTPPATPTPAATASATPGATPNRSPTAVPTRSPVRSTPPAPRPSTSTSPPPPPDVTAPTVAGVAANPTQIEPKGCLYGYKSSTLSATVTDDRTGADALRVTFRYTVDKVTSTVRMSSAGRGLFQGTLGPLPTPGTTQRIPIFVTALDAAGNATSSASPVYVTFYNYCTPG